MSLKNIAARSMSLFLVVVGISLVLPVPFVAGAARPLGLTSGLSLMLAWVLCTVGVAMLSRMFRHAEQLSWSTLRHISTLEVTRRGRNCAVLSAVCFVVSFFAVHMSVAGQLPIIGALLQAVSVGSGVFALVFAFVLSALFRVTAKQNLDVSPVFG